MLRQQQFLEVFLEGTRSRSGKPSPARAGMLSIVVDALCNGVIPEVMVVPVGISYDRILEGNYNSEQLVRTCVCGRGRQRSVCVCEMGSVCWICVGVCFVVGGISLNTTLNVYVFAISI